MKKIRATCSKVVTAIGTVVRKAITVLPGGEQFVIGAEKAAAGFVAPILLTQAARFIPGVHLDPSIVGQAVLGIFTAAGVYFTRTTPPTNGA